MKSKCVLLVDDEQHIADVVVYVLQQNGFKVLTALDGDAGLRLFTQYNPDLVVLDLNLPSISGMDLFREMPRFNPRSDRFVDRGYCRLKQSLTRGKSGFNRNSTQVASSQLSAEL